MGMDINEQFLKGKESLTHWEDIVLSDNEDSLTEKFNEQAYKNKIKTTQNKFAKENGHYIFTSDKHRKVSNNEGYSSSVLVPKRIKEAVAKACNPIYSEDTAFISSKVSRELNESIWLLIEEGRTSYITSKLKRR